MSLEFKENKKMLKFIEEINDTFVDYPQNKTLTRLFEEQVKKTPDNVAIVDYDLTITYRELNEKVNLLARCLMERNVKKEEVIAIMINKSIEMIVAIFAIQKVGAAYMPIDPDYPEQRVMYMLNDSRAKLILTEDMYRNKLSFFNGEVLDVHDEDLYKGDNTNLEREFESNNLACVIYTSGSTGKPKGVLIEHRGIVRQVKNVTFINIGENDAMLQLANYVFVASVLDFFLPLLNGAKVILIHKEDILNLDKLEKIIVDNNVTIAACNTSIFNLIVDNKIECFKNLKTVTAGGEQVSVRHIKKALDYLGPDRLMQFYGQTESSLLAAYYPINSVKEDSIRIPIGKPVNNTALYVLKENNQLADIDEIGELCVSGHGTARGYLNLDELTKERFVKDPFKDNSVMFKTGDLAKYRSDGNIELIGRRDNQVKIRGFRVELEEIESQLLKLDYIKEAAVVAKNDSAGDDVLHGYITANEEIAVTVIKDELSKTLPHYMIPNIITQIDKMPFTPTRKIDRKKLKEINLDTGDKEIVLPRNDMEHLIYDNFKKILPSANISIYDDFEVLGGTSIGAAKMISNLSNSGIDITLEKIFIYKSVARIAEYIESRDNEDVDLIDKMTLCLNYKKDQKKNLIFLPGAGGTTISYLEISREIERAKGIYALMEPRIHGGDFNVFKDKDTIINKYLECIENIFEDGDFIGGHSFGGLLAFKVCYELEKRGRKPKGLIIMDTPAVIPEGNLNEEEIKKATLLLIFGKIMRRISKKESENLEKLEYKKVEEYISKLNFNKEAGEELTETKMQSHLRLLMDNIRMMKMVNFIDGPISVPIIVLRAVERIDEEYENVTKWDKYTTSSCKVIDVPGNHYTMIKSPNSMTLSKYIDKFIEELN